MSFNTANPETLVLFDVDGTLTPARKEITPQMLQMLKTLRKSVVVGFVGGSDLPKQQEQIGPNVVSLFDFAFAENGLTAYRLGEKLDSQSFIAYLGEQKYKSLVDFVLIYIAKLDIPVKRGTFVEFRNVIFLVTQGMINISPIGRNCSHPERDEFEKYDLERGIRAEFVRILKEEFKDLNLTFSIGGQISFDVFPSGWDKRYCLNHLKNENFKTIHFFGDKTFKGGNDYEIFSDARVIGHTVVSPDDTFKQVTELFLS